MIRWLRAHWPFFLIVFLMALPGIILWVMAWVEGWKLRAELIPNLAPTAVADAMGETGGCKSAPVAIPN